MKQTVMWLALALLFAIGVTLSVTADSFWPAATAETTASATVVEALQPVVAANAKPANQFGNSAWNNAGTTSLLLASWRCAAMAM